MSTFINLEPNAWLAAVVDKINRDAGEPRFRIVKVEGNAVYIMLLDSAAGGEVWKFDCSVAREGFR